MKDVKWPDLTGFGARLVVSPANQYRSKTAMLLVDDQEYFKKEIEKANPNKTFEQVLVDAHFYEVENDENKYAYYYRNNAKLGIDLNDVKKLFPLLSNENNVFTSQNNIYLTQLPFTKNIPNWKSYFTLVTERYSAYPEVFISEIKSESEISKDIQNSIVQSNKSYLKSFQSSSLPFNRLEDYGYKGIFSKIYLNEEAALSNGESIENLKKVKLSPFSITLNIENNGSILIIDDIRQIPELFAYNPYETLNLTETLDLIQFAQEYDETFKQLIDHIRDNDIFRMSVKDIDIYVKNLSDDLEIINEVFYKPGISYPIFNETINDQGIPSILKDKNGTWNLSINGEEERLTDRGFYDCLLLRHDFCSQLIKQLPNNKVYDSELNESYMQITASSVIKFNQLYDFQSSILKQNELINALNEDNVSDILTDLDVDFNATDKKDFTEKDILNIANSSSGFITNNKQVLKNLLQLPENLLDDRGNKKVREFAPAMLEIRQILDAYVIPKAKDLIAGIEIEYSKYLDKKYEDLELQIKSSANNNTFNPDIINEISDEVDSYNIKISTEYNNIKRILWESEALVSGVSAGTNSFLFNKESFYFKKDENNQLIKFDSEIELKQHKVSLYKLLSEEFNDQLISARTPEFKNLIGNSTAIEMLLNRINPYQDQQISNIVNGEYFDNNKIADDKSILKTSDLFTVALVNNDKQENIYLKEFNEFLEASKFNEELLYQSLAKTSKTNLYNYGVYETLWQKLLIAQSDNAYKRKGDGNSIIDDVFSKTSSYKDGFSLDRVFNRLVELKAFQKSLTLHYPKQDWSFLSVDFKDDKLQTILDEMNRNFLEDQKDLTEIQSSIERQFYKLGSNLFAINKDLAADEAFVQVKPIGQTNDLSMIILNKNDIRTDLHYTLSNDPFKATVQLYENIANNAVENILYLNNGDLEKAKYIASLLIGENNSFLKNETFKIFNVSLSIDDFNQFNTIKLDNDIMVLNNKVIPNSNYNNLQLYNFLNLVDINRRSLFGKFDISVSDDFKVVKELLRPNTSFQNNIKYFSITDPEINITYSNELDFFDKQLENAVVHFEERYGLINIPNNNIYILPMQKDDMQYLRLFDYNDKSIPFIGQSVSLDANIYKSAGFTDRDAVKISTNVFFKLGTRNNPATFMPPAKFTFEKYYDSDLNFFKARLKDKSLVNKIFTSLPNNLLNNIIDNPSIHGIKQNFRSNRHIELNDKLEDLIFDKKVNESKSFLSKITPSYAYVMAHVDGHTAFLPKNLVSTFETNNFTDIHPFDLLNSNVQKQDLIDIFTKGIDGNPEFYLSKIKYRNTLGKIGNPEKEFLQPRFYDKQFLVNEEFANRYLSVKDLSEVDTLLMQHIESLKSTLESSYFERYKGSTPSKHHYTLLNKNSNDDVTPQLYLVDRNYEEYLAGQLISYNSPDFSYINIQGFSDPHEYKYEITTTLKTKANLGSFLENIALSNLPNHKIIHKNDYMNKQLASLQYQSLISNVLSSLYDKLGDAKHFISTKNSKLVLAHKPSSDTDYSTFKLFKDHNVISDEYKALCLFPVKALNSVEDVLAIQKTVFTDYNLINQFIPKIKFEPGLAQDHNALSTINENVYLGDVGKKFGGAHKDRYGEYISLEYISNTSPDQTATDYRKAKIIANKEFQLWYTNTNLAIDDKIFIKAMYDYCPPKPLFSKNALMMESLRANELRAYVAIVANLKNLMVDTKDELLSAIKSNQHLTAERLGFTDRQRRDYIGLYSKGTKHNYKNYLEILSNLDDYYIGPGHTGGISVQLEKILEKTIDKEFSKILSTGKIFDFYAKLKVDKDISDAISNMQRTGLYSSLLEPYVLKNAIEIGLVKPESDPVYVNDPSPVIKALQEENTIHEKKDRQPKVPSFTSNLNVHENGYITEKIQSNVYGLLNFSRTGPNFRNGENVDSFNLKNTFEISGVEFGNKVSPVAQQLVNAVHDSFNDLKLLMGFKSNEGLLNVGVALASRGIKGSAAHYELSKNVVNLTRDQGAGSLAHEYAHALDAYLGTLEKAEVYKNQALLSRNILMEYYEEIPNFEIPNARHFLSKMLDAGYSPMTESGRAFENIYQAMLNQPVEQVKNYGALTKEKAEDAIKLYHQNLDQCIDEVITHKGVYAPSDKKTLDSFFDWHERHYSDLVERQFEKIEDYLKKYSSEYKDDDNLSFFRTVRDKVDTIISKINTDINSLSFKSYERFQERKNEHKQPEYHLPTQGIEEKVKKIFIAAEVDLSDMSASMSKYLAEASKFKFYNLVEKYMPEGVKDPHTQMQMFFDKTNNVSEINLEKVHFSNVISRYKEDCLNLDRHENRSTPYYGTSTEMFARYFETYLYSKIAASKDISNTFLIDGYPQVMPKGLEFEVCNVLTDKFINTCVNQIFDKDLTVTNDQQLRNQNIQKKDSDSLDLTI